MSTNRLVYVLITISLVAIALLVGLEALSTEKVITADRRYDALEQQRAFSVSVDRSYDSIEAQRLGMAGKPVGLDLSYAQLEELRLARTAGAPTAERFYDAIEQLRLDRD